MNPVFELLRAWTVDPHGAGDLEQSMTNDAWNQHAESSKAALTIAADRRFGGSDHGDVVRWVADVRARAGDREGESDPLLAERLIGAVACDDAPPISGSVNGDAFARVVMLYVPAMLRDLELSDEDLDAFFAEAEELAQEWQREG